MAYRGQGHAKTPVIEWIIDPKTPVLCLLLQRTLHHAYSFIAVTLVAQLVKVKGYGLLNVLYRIYTGTVYLCADICLFDPYLPSSRKLLIS